MDLTQYAAEEILSIMFPHKVKPPVIVILRQEVLFSQCPFFLVQSTTSHGPFLFHLTGFKHARPPAFMFGQMPYLFIVFANRPIARKYAGSGDILQCF